MLSQLELDAAERDAVESVLSTVRTEWAFSENVDLRHLLMRWEKTVKEVERGYELGPGDFMQDLDLREALDEIAAAVPPRVGRAIENAVRPLDARFFAATVLSEKPLSAPSQGETLKPWWFRVPSKISEIEPGAWQRFLLTP